MRRKVVRRMLAVLAALVGISLLVVAWMMLTPASALRTIQHWTIDTSLDGHEVQAKAGPVKYWETGSGPTVMLVHGFGDSGAGFVPVANDLSRDHHVVVIDLPGHGRSAPLDRAPTFDEMLAGLGAVADTIDGPFTLVGNSMGGWLAGVYALEHPDRLERVVLMNAAGLTQDIDRSLLIPETREAMLDKNRAVMGEHAPSLPGPLLDGMVEMSSTPKVKVLYDHLMQTPRLDDRIGELAVPAVLLWGTPDPFFPVEGYLDRLRVLLPRAQTWQLDGCAHAPQYSCPSEMAEALRMVSTPGAL